MRRIKSLPCRLCGKQVKPDQARVTEPLQRKDLPVCRECRPYATVSAGLPL
jgi:hypothetical protein